MRDRKYEYVKGKNIIREKGTGIDQRNIYVVICLLFLSGFTSLVYQVLWMRKLGLLFGSTSHAAAGTVAVFFGGLAIGSALWSRRAPRSAKPLAEYGLVEIGVALSGVLYFSLMTVYAWVYSPLHEVLGESQTLLLFAKLILAAGVLLPPAILMGATLPLMSQYIVNAKETLGRAGTLLYGMNTLGAAAGALVAGFWLPAWLGFRGAYLVAVVASLVIGVVAWVLGRKPDRDPRGDSSVAAIEQPPKKGSNKKLKKLVSLNSPKLWVVAAGSGSLALALEVLWTRMFQQVLQNSVYTFSIILVIFLASLAAGAFVARRIARSQMDPWFALAILLTAAAVGTLASPFLFYQVTDGMRYLGAGEGWTIYLASVLSGAALVLFLPGVTIGSVFPYLLRVAEGSGEAGQVMGRLSAINTAGAIIGSLVAGFALLGWLGLWTSLLVVGILYLLLAVWVAFACSLRVALGPALVLILSVTLLNPSKLPGVRLNADTEELLASWEGPDAYVAVIERGGSRRIKINNYYALGSSAAIEHERNQTLIPLMPHPSPERLYYLGMGTGITAGAAMRLPSQEVTVTELIPEVITAASEFFNNESFGLFTDPRVRVLARDGRNELRGRNEKYDAILADLFIPWRAGVGNLYSYDHYVTARERLRPGGVYVQWIPLYQVTDVEFWTIVRTFLEAFPQVRVWRGDFYVDKPILALVGSVDAEPLSASSIVNNGRHLRGNANLDPTAFLAVTLPFYAGNLGGSLEIVPDGPIHTDDYPVIDYQAPISHRNARAGRVEWFVGTELIGFFRQLQSATPPENDPYLRQLNPTARRFVSAGLSYHTGAMLGRMGKREEANRLLQEFVSLLPVPIEFETVGKGSAVVEEEK